MSVLRLPVSAWKYKKIIALYLHNHDLHRIYGRSCNIFTFFMKIIQMTDGILTICLKQYAFIYQKNNWHVSHWKFWMIYFMFFVINMLQQAPTWLYA
jgi:hypothetical protein